MINNTRQDVSRWSVFLNKTHSFASGWGLNYGVHGGYASSKNYSEYLYEQGAGYEMDEEALEDKRNTSLIFSPRYRKASESVSLLRSG